MMKFLYLTILILLISGCNYEYTHKETPKTEIEAVYWNSQGTYTAAIVENNEIIFKRINRDYQWDIKVIPDVTLGKMWYTCKENSYHSGWSGYHYLYALCEIHVRNTNDISTSRANLGKFGYVDTHRIN